MFTTTVTTRIKDKFGIQAEVEKHRAKAAETFFNPELVGSVNGADDDTEETGLTVTTTWKEGPEPKAWSRR